MPRLCSSLLVANRGEIACRIMRTARALGIRTVGVFSEPDARAPHVALADEAVCIGPAASTSSYLNIDAVMEAVRQTGAEAVHPGYGFLSENAAFAEAVEAAGVAFVGPGPSAINAMGDKIESKRLAKEARVTTIPGFAGILADEDEAAKVAIDVGFPVMIKASAGGGGKGMRIAWNEAEARAGFAVSSREAAAAFGDNRVFIERYVHRARHIELQLLADAHGECVYLPPRECSIQRRNQKVVEEAPVAHLSPETLAKMGAEAVALAKAVGYRSAGTLEFLVDSQQQHYFLEMNTRLQVEHPVTELVSGIDLVEAMLRIAAGERMWLKQEELHPVGWAFESRLYAEDPLRGFLPSSGTLSRYVPPAEAAVLAAVGAPPASGGRVRVDDGVREGSVISLHYDPMIAKLVTHGQDREHARELMVAALDRYVIGGLRHNQNFLRSLMSHERFAAADLTTAFIPEEYPEGYSGHQLSPAERIDFVAAVGALQHAADAQASSVAGVEARRSSGSEISVRIDVDGEVEHELTIERQADSSPVVNAGDVIRVRGSGHGTEGWERTLRLLATGLGPSGLFEAQLEPSLSEAPASSRSLVMQVHERRHLGWQLCVFGTMWPVLSRPKRFAELAMHMLPPPQSEFAGALISPMPGTLLSLAVGKGDKVVAGQALCVVEAMKMQNVIVAERDGVVREIFANAGKTLAADDPIMTFV